MHYYFINFTENLYSKKFPLVYNILPDTRLINCCDLDNYIKGLGKSSVAIDDLCRYFSTGPKVTAQYLIILDGASSNAFFLDLILEIVFMTQPLLVPQNMFDRYHFLRKFS